MVSYFIMNSKKHQVSLECPNTFYGHCTCICVFVCICTWVFLGMSSIKLFKSLLSPAFRDGWWQQLAASGRVAFDRRGRLMVWCVSQNECKRSLYPSILPRLHLLSLPIPLLFWSGSHFQKARRKELKRKSGLSPCLCCYFCCPPASKPSFLLVLRSDYFSFARFFCILRFSPFLLLFLWVFDLCHGTLPPLMTN